MSPCDRNCALCSTPAGRLAELLIGAVAILVVAALVGDVIGWWSVFPAVPAVAP